MQLLQFIDELIDLPQLLFIFAKPGPACRPYQINGSNA
jgi:hypothetical protein